MMTLRPQDPLSKAATRLIEEQVSGAPVVDDAGACVGVLSVTDLIVAPEKAAAERQKVAESSFFNAHLALPYTVYASKLEEVRDKLAPTADQPVERFMTTDLVSVGESTPLDSVVKRLVSAHIHRVLVLDDDRRLKGIISTTDVLAALLRAAGGSTFV
jgi:CBS domain-containing protein